jgi:hypothetical protein
MHDAVAWQRLRFSLRQLAAPGTVLADQTKAAVTFVENHDVVRDDPIVHDKMLVYAFILTHQGYPCVFWQDYYAWGLALPGEMSGIAALCARTKTMRAARCRYCMSTMICTSCRGLAGSTRADWFLF